MVKESSSRLTYRSNTVSELIVIVEDTVVISELANNFKKKLKVETRNQISFRHLELYIFDRFEKVFY